MARIRVRGGGGWRICGDPRGLGPDLALALFRSRVTNKPRSFARRAIVERAPRGIAEDAEVVATTS